MGAWIEIELALDIAALYFVAPYMGAWIEIVTIYDKKKGYRLVAPFMGAWIEITTV